MLNIKDKSFFEEIKRIMKFSIIGVINTLLTMGVDDGLFYLFNIDKNISFSIGYFLGMLNSYIMNSIFTFKSKTALKNPRNKMLKFVIINILSYLAALFAKDFGAVVFSTQGKNYINSLFGVVAAQVINYLGYKLWVFGDKSSDDKA
ncbi:MAG: GtrA family protein [Bacillota bacterium]|nr:GtrA family protein [Bacillota bacterium]